MRFLDRMDCINTDGSINEAKAKFILEYIYPTIQRRGKWQENISRDGSTQYFIVIPNPLDSSVQMRIGISKPLTPNSKITTFIADASSYSDVGRVYTEFYEAIIP